MQMTKFEKLGVECSRLSFGCMRLPLQADGKIDRKAGGEMVDYAYKNGITYFDTAYYYHKHESEVFLGEAIKKYPRETYQLATKLPIWSLAEGDTLDNIFNTQLERLQTDYIDFYLVHAMSKERMNLMSEYKVFEYLKAKQAEGKIKYIGFSFHDKTEVFDEIVDAYPWDFVQIQLNYIDVEILGAMKLYDCLAKRNIPAVVMEPVRGGFLATLPDVAKDLFTAHNPTQTMSQWAFKWVANLPNVKVILSGMSTMEQMVENINTFSGDMSLTEADYAVYAKAVEKILAIKTVSCTACGYCMPCPFGVDIPNVFKIYNSLKMFNNLWRTKEEYYNYFDESKRGSNCRGCGECVSKCPQQLDIPTLLKDVDAQIYQAKLTIEAAR